MRSQDSGPLSSAVAVVTGGSRGIGLAVAAKLSEMDATVVITGRDEGRLRQVANELGVNGRRINAMCCDVADLASVEKFGERLRREHGRVDILVNNAGIAVPRDRCTNCRRMPGTPFSTSICAACIT